MPSANSELNANNMISYAFHSVPGYSKIGTYKGTGIDNLVDLGFKPGFVMIKRINGTGDWIIFENKRNLNSSGNNNLLYANLSNLELVSAGESNIITTENGFKARYTNFRNNENGGEYLYYAISE